MKRAASATSGWIRRRLDEVATLQTGIAKSPRLRRDAVLRPFLRVANVQDGHLDLRDVHSIEVERAQLERYELQPGDVLMTEGGDFDKLGRGTVWRGEIPGCVHQNHVFAVRPDQTYLLPEFLAAWTTSSTGRRFFRSSSKQTTNLASINASQVRAARLFLPSVSVQEEIVAVLRSSDSLIASTAALAAQRFAYFRWLMGDLLLGQRRFRRHDRTGRRTFAIGDVVEEVSRPVTWSEEESYPLLSIRRRSGGTFLRERRLGALIKGKALFRVQEGDFLISRMQVAHGALGLVRREHAGMCVSSTYDVLRSRDPAALDIRYFDYLSRLPSMYRRIRLACHGVHIEKMTFVLSDFMKIPITIPDSIEEQRSVVECLEEAQREVSVLEELAPLYKVQRHALMDRLLGGEATE